MQIHALDFNDFDEEEYVLIAIHTTLEDYKLAYLLNKNLHTNFIKSSFNLDFKNQKNDASFSLYEYQNNNSENAYFLIANSHKKEQLLQANGLLLSSETRTYLIPEKKKTDYFLKINGISETETIVKLIEKLNQIPQVVTAYLVDYKTLKSKEFLIF